LSNLNINKKLIKIIRTFKFERSRIITLICEHICTFDGSVPKYHKGPFGAHDMIEIVYDMKLDKDRK